MNEYGYDTHGMKAFTDETFTAEINLSDIPRGTLQAILGGVPIIRCGDCIHFRRIEDTGFGRCMIHHDGTHGQRMVQIVDYCSWAERKDKDETD